MKVRIRRTAPSASPGAVSAGSSCKNVEMIASGLLISCAIAPVNAATAATGSSAIAPVMSWFVPRKLRIEPSR